MADSAKLYVNPQKWEMHDLYDLVVTHANVICGPIEPIQVKFCDAQPGKTMWIYYPIKKGPGMVMITKSDVGGFPAWLVDISARREKSLKLLKSIGEKTGGIFCDNEAHSTFEEFQDKFAEDHDFVLKLIQKDASRFAGVHAVRHQDLDGLLEALNKLREDRRAQTETEDN